MIFLFLVFMHSYCVFIHAFYGFMDSIEFMNVYVSCIFSLCLCCRTRNGPHYLCACGASSSSQVDGQLPPGIKERFENAINCIFSFAEGRQHFLGWWGSYDLCESYVDAQYMVSCVPLQAGTAFCKALGLWRKSKRPVDTGGGGEVDAKGGGDGGGNGGAEVQCTSGGDVCKFASRYFKHHVKFPVPAQSNEESFLYFRTRVLKVKPILDFTYEHFKQSDKFQSNGIPHLLTDVLQTLCGTGHAKDESSFLKALIGQLFLHAPHFFLGFGGNEDNVKRVVPQENRTCCVAGHSWRSFHQLLCARAIQPDAVQIPVGPHLQSDKLLDDVKEQGQVGALFVARLPESLLNDVEEHAQYVPSMPDENGRRMWYLWKADKLTDHPYTLSKFLHTRHQVGDTIQFKGLYKGQQKQCVFTSIPTVEVLQFRRWSIQVMPCLHAISKCMEMLFACIFKMHENQLWIRIHELT